MPDVTDSYCERCGARYIFNPNAVKGLSLKGARVFAKGLKNFVLTDGQSMSDSLALARHEDDHQDSSKLTEAFHRTFNFCLTCRQYACDKCWNVKVGACLSCAPDELGYSVPVRPKQRPLDQPAEPLFVPARQAEWDADWSLFSEAAAAGTTAPPAPAGFNEPIRFSEPVQTPAVATLPAAETPNTAPAWPLMDLPDAAPAASTGSGKGTHKTPHKQVDRDAATLWPIADQIAPEMTLTPEELELVESSLGQGEIVIEMAPVANVAPEPDLFEAPAAVWTPDVPAYAEPVVEEPVIEEPMYPAAWGASWRTASPSPWDNRAPSPAHAAASDDQWIETQPPSPAPLLEPIPEEVAAAANLPEPVASPHHILRMSLPSLSHPEVRPPERDRTPDRKPMVARLLGRHGSAHQDQAGGEPWPHATAWAERPVKAQDWTAPESAPVEEAPQAEIPAAVAAAAFAEPFAASAPPQHAFMPAYPAAQLPHREDNGDADARSAAAVRLSAVASNEGSQPINPLASPATPAVPAWPEADHEVARGASPQSAPAPEWSQARRDLPAQPEPLATRPAAPSPWPPLGASWPAQEDPNAPWRGPETAPMPAVVAAQASPAPTLSEMWAQSAQEVATRGTVRVCSRCALPVSTQARFCRRCGTRQS